MRLAGLRSLGEPGGQRLRLDACFHSLWGREVELSDSRKFCLKVTHSFCLLSLVKTSHLSRPNWNGDWEDYNSSPVIRKICQLYISRILWSWLSWLRRWPHGTFSTRGVLRRNSVCHCWMTLAIEHKLYGEKRCDMVLGLIIVCFSISRSFWNGKIGNWVTFTVPSTAWAGPHMWLQVSHWPREKVRAWQLFPPPGSLFGPAAEKDLGHGHCLD